MEEINAPRSAYRDAPVLSTTFRRAGAVGTKTTSTSFDTVMDAGARFNNEILTEQTPEAMQEILDHSDELLYGLTPDMQQHIFNQPDLATADRGGIEDA